MDHLHIQDSYITFVKLKDAIPGDSVYDIIQFVRELNDIEDFDLVFDKFRIPEKVIYNITSGDRFELTYRGSTDLSVTGLEVVVNDIIKLCEKHGHLLNI